MNNGALQLEGGGSNYTALMIATHFGDTQMITHIVNAGADINYRDSSSNVRFIVHCVAKYSGKSLTAQLFQSRMRSWAGQP
jgi:hypothetical protein